jgi:hypothetical protein
MLSPRPSSPRPSSPRPSTRLPPQMSTPPAQTSMTSWPPTRILSMTRSSLLSSPTQKSHRYTRQAVQRGSAQRQTPCSSGECLQVHRGQPRSSLWSHRSSDPSTRSDKGYARFHKRAIAGPGIASRAPPTTATRQVKHSSGRDGAHRRVSLDPDDEAVQDQRTPEVKREGSTPSIGTGWSQSGQRRHARFAESQAVRS